MAKFEKGRRSAPRIDPAGRTMALLELSENPRNELLNGIVLIVTGVSIMSLQDAFIKLVSGRYPLYEIMVIRTLFAIGPVLCMVHWEGGLRLLRTGRPGLHLLRGFALFLAYYCYFSALAALPMAEAVSIFFISPLIVTLLSVRLLREHIGLEQIIVLVVGFSGVLIMVRPGAAALDTAALLAMAAAFFYALAVVMTRYLGTSAQGSVLAFYPSLVYILGGTLFGLVLGDGRFSASSNPMLQFLLGAWRWPTLLDLGLLALTGVMASISFYCLSQAYRLAQPSSIAPFEYIAMPLSTLWGFIFFADTLDGFTIIGMALIAGSGLYLAGRSRLSLRHPTRNGS